MRKIMWHSLVCAFLLGSMPALRAEFNVLDYGCKGDGASDDTMCVRSALKAAADTGGGSIYFPSGHRYLILGQISIPNDSRSFPDQFPITLRGDGGAWDGTWSSLTSGAATLDMRYAGPTAKIDTRGRGVLRIEGLAFVDGGSDSTPFILTTNTTLIVQHNSFRGSGSGGESSVNDGLVLGGTTQSMGGGPDAPFQGYGTVIRENYFARVRRAVFGQEWANGVEVQYNTISNDSGNKNGGAIVWQRGPVVPGADNGQYGNIIENNLIEVAGYRYGVQMMEGSNHNTIIGNSCYDANTPLSAACIYLSPDSTNNIVMMGIVGATSTIAPVVAGPDNIILEPRSMLISTGGKINAGTGYMVAGKPLASVDLSDSGEIGRASCRERVSNCV